MPITAAERRARAVVDEARKTIDIEAVRSAQTIRAAALKAFTAQLDGKLKNLQDGETLQITFRVDIIGADNTIRGGSGSERDMPEYIAWRAAVYARDTYTCQECGETRGLNAHHIKSWSLHPALRFDVANGVTLCAPCHAAKHPHLRFMRHGKADKARTKDRQTPG